MSIAVIVIRVIHISIILFVLSIPYITNNPDILLLHAMGSLTLIAHWYMESNVCSLTLLESRLRGIPMDKSFMHQIVSPIYDISDTTLSDICWVVTLGNMFVSTYKIRQLSKQGVYPQVVHYFLN